jgi:hypothetical protein
MLLWEVEEEKASPLPTPDSSTKLSIIGFCSPKNLMVYIIPGEKKEDSKAPTIPHYN